jgi:peptidyl-prolyl cis-trans isomerase D
MFDFVHKHKWLIQILLALIAVPFAFFGVDSFTRSMLRGADEVAKVEGVTVTQREFETALRQQTERLRAMFGTNVDIAELDTPELRNTLLDSLIEQKLLFGAALKSNLGVSDQALRELIASIPAFQSEGKFSKEMYDSQLRAQGMDPATFEAQLRRDLSTAQLSRGISDSAIFPRSVAQRLDAIEEEKREVSELRIGAQSFLAQVKIDPAAVQAHYDANPADYRLPERMRVEYLVFSASDLDAGESASDAELQEAYRARLAKRGDSEQRRASHILIPVDAGAKDEDKKAARAKAEAILAEVRKSPGKFAELAKKYSKDPGSAEKGGDLGFFARGMMVKPFEDAAFAMKKEGEISNLVESEFGFHVIRLTGIKGSNAPSLAQLSGELRAEIKKEKAIRKFAQEGGEFKDMVYEQADSLQPIATRFKLSLHRSDWFSRKTPPAQLGPLGNPKVVSALFAEDSIRARRNIDAVQIAPNTLLAARVVDYQPAAQRPLDEAKAEIEQLLRKREAAKLARAEGAAQLEKLTQGGAAGIKLGAPRTVSRRDTQGVRTDALQRILAADASKLPVYVGAELGDDGYAIYRVEKIIPAPAKTGEKSAADFARNERAAGRAQYSSYVASLRASADVKINQELLEKKQ